MQNEILMFLRGASAVPFMKRAFYQMLTNIGGFQKDLEDTVNSWNYHADWPGLLPCPTVVEETEVLAETLLVPGPWPNPQVTCRGPRPADGLLHLSAWGVLQLRELGS